MSSACDPGKAAPPRVRAAADVGTHVGPGGEGENPSSGADGSATRAVSLRDLGGALESFLDARSGDDVVAVAEAEACLQRALFVPELVEVLTQALELRGGGRVVSLREDVPQLRAPLAQLLDLLVNPSDGHVFENDGRTRLIPAGRRRKRLLRERRRRPRRRRSTRAR